MKQYIYSSYGYAKARAGDAVVGKYSTPFILTHNEPVILY